MLLICKILMLVHLNNAPVFLVAIQPFRNTFTFETRNRILLLSVLISVSKDVSVLHGRPSSLLCIYIENSIISNFKVLGGIANFIFSKMVGLVNRKACVIVLIIFVRLSSGTSLEDSSVIENLQNISDSDGIFSFVKRHICHKIRFCTSEPNTPSEDSSSDCCEQCSCAANCFEFGNCCPDVINVIEQNLTVSCKNFDEIYLVNETYKDLWPQLASDQRYLQSYYIIDSCFQGNFTELDDPCSVETVNDLAPVMDVENNILYKNRKCASCNGAENVIDLNVQQRSCFSEAFAYRSPVAIVKEFYRTCEPVILPSMDINWHFECYENLAMISQCRYVGRARYYDWGENYDRLEELCQNDSLIFPMYTASASYYKNPFCFLCNLYFDDVPGQITTQISSCANPSNTRSSTGDITNGNVFPRSRTLIGIKSSTQPCDSDDMIFNPDLVRMQFNSLSNDSTD